VGKLLSLQKNKKGDISGDILSIMFLSKGQIQSICTKFKIKSAVNSDFSLVSKQLNEKEKDVLKNFHFHWLLKNNI
jgi:hypothetical protein